MSEPIQVGDRVTWRSTRMNSQGLYRRAGVVLRVHAEGRFAFVKPDIGMGHAQHITLGRLTKVEVQP